jgi:hypothetical protein
MIIQSFKALVDSEIPGKKTEQFIRKRYIGHMKKSTKALMALLLTIMILTALVYFKPRKSAIEDKQDNPTETTTVQEDPVNEKTEDTGKAPVIEHPPVITEQVREKGPKTLLTIKAEDITNIEYISSRKGTVTFNKNGPSWIVGNGSYNRINNEKVESLLKNLITLKSLETVSFSSENTEQWGINDDSEKIKIKTSKGTLTVRIGTLSPDGKGYYIQIDNVEEIYLVSNSYSPSLKVSLDDIRIRELPAFDVTQLSSLTLRKGSVIKIEPFKRSDMFTSDSFQYMLTEPYLYTVPVSNQKLAGLLDTMKVSLKIVDFIDRGTPEEYGLQKDGSKLIFMEKSGKTFNMLLGNETNQGKIYGKLADEDQIFTLDKNDLPFLGVKAFDLVDLHPHLIEMNTIDALSVTTDEVAIIATIDRKENKIIYSLNGMETEEKTFKGLYNDILQMQVEGEVNQNKVGEISELTISYKLYDGGSHWTHLSFYPYSDAYYAVGRNNEDPLFTISRNQVKKTLEKVIKTVDTVMGF